MDLEAVQRQAQSTRAMTDSRIADIRANKALSDGGKRQLIAVEVKRCADALEKLRLEDASRGSNGTRSTRAQIMDQYQPG